MGSLIFDEVSCRQIGYDLLQLLHFVELNATGIRKILKKFDKRVGFRLGNQYIASRANHPYSQLQQVFRQVVRLPLSTFSPLRCFESNATYPPYSVFGRLQAVFYYS